MKLFILNINIISIVAYGILNVVDEDSRIVLSPSVETVLLLVAGSHIRGCQLDTALNTIIPVNNSIGIKLPTNQLSH